MSVATRPGQPSWADVNRDVARTVSMPGNTYFAWMCLVALILGCGVLAWAFQIWTGMGAAGKRTPQMWAMYITTFVFWIGIGHAGTLISAILYLFRAKWRTSIYRGAEAMTVFAVMTAGLFPLIHAGRMWFAYWLTPYPNQRYLWPNFKSPLVWDVFAISTYLTISVVFFLVGLVPDIAALRDQSTGVKKKIYAVMSLGWEGSDSQWRHYRRAYGLLASLATPLVLSVHSVVSFDFAMALVPGWHSTLFAPFFVDGAIFSGFAMVLLLMLPMRYLFNWFNYTWTAPLDQQLNPDVTVRQLGVMEKCTMCIQRIEKGKNDAREAGRAVKDGDIQTACQQTCPTQAISFGNLKEGAARVTKLSASPRSYHVLQSLGTRPAVTYLAKVVRGETGDHGAEKGHKA